ncbi:hypothetical protein [Novosphingopyxis sp.]|uniref:hypothetical protein n=1 Tax=Novosphingopyxis sp. TaxID=2709690 RepID=UPI003B5AB2FC
MGFLKSLAGTLIGEQIGQKTAGRGLLGAGIGFLVTRVATRSLPGAALVGGGYLAKLIYDKRKEKRAEQAANSTGLSAEDTDMAMARAAGETAIAEDTGSGAMRSAVAIDGSAQAEQLDAIPPRPVTD